MEDLFKRLGIKIKDINLYNSAFSHSSYANEHKKKIDYERLEFLGDAVIDLVISEYLYQKSDLGEGQMTKLRASYVCEDALYRYSTDLELNKYLKVGHGEEKSGGKHKKAIVADIFEALMGAIYLDLGFDTVRRIILEIVVPYIEDEEVIFFNDYKSSLGEAVQTDNKSLQYEVIKESGPDHDKLFVVAVIVDGITLGKGEAKSKKEAEQQAAKDALEKLAL
ncbi:MAG: ribonuclease III [Bacilli bacterium]|nr:ribonuclease III [Bacilli bacterium]